MSLSIGEQKKWFALTLPPPFFFYLTSPPLSNQKLLVHSQEQKLLLHMATTFEHSFLIYCSSRVSLLYMCLSSTGDSDQLQHVDSACLPLSKSKLLHQLKKVRKERFPNKWKDRKSYYGLRLYRNDRGSCESPWSNTDSQSYP